MNKSRENLIILPFGVYLFTPNPTISSSSQTFCSLKEYHYLNIKTLLTVELWEAICCSLVFCSNFCGSIAKKSSSMKSPTLSKRVFLSSSFLFCSRSLILLMRLCFFLPIRLSILALKLRWMEYLSAIKVCSLRILRRFSSSLTKSSSSFLVSSRVGRSCSMTLGLSPRWGTWSGIITLRFSIFPSLLFYIKTYEYKLFICLWVIMWEHWLDRKKNQRENIALLMINTHHFY